MQPRITGEISIWACLWDYLDFVLTDVRKPILIVSWTDSFGRESSWAIRSGDRKLSMHWFLSASQQWMQCDQLL